MFKIQAVAQRLWGHKAKISTLLIAAVVLIFSFLGARDIWTQEHRWADIVAGMFYRQDFFHPYLGMVRYYDKPLLSYWLIAFTVKSVGVFNNFVLRFPTACSALVAILSIYSLGKSLKNQQLGLLAGWLLLTTFYFLFWARVSSADMLNMAGALCAIAWYMNKRATTHLFDYTVFFLMVAFTCLCKGLVGGIIVFIAVVIDMILTGTLRKHFNIKMLLALAPALIVYLLPFWASSHYDHTSYGENGLYLVYKENILRYFQPFDHQGPIYTYLIYLPLYTLPWAIFFIPAIIGTWRRWPSLSRNSKWLSWTLLALFLFFSLSGSRRSYYVLSIVPFAILYIADWLSRDERRCEWAAGITIVMLCLLFLAVDLAPAWFYSQYGARVFAERLQEDAQPWSKWNVVLLDTESKLNFYLQLPPHTQTFSILGKERGEMSSQTLLQRWPILADKPADTIFITRKLYATNLEPYFQGYHKIELAHYPTLPFLKNYQQNAPVAFVPDK